MKTYFAFLSAVLFSALLSVQAASVAEGALESRGHSRYGGLNQKCRTKHQPPCDPNLTCFQGQCLGSTQRPNKAPCANGADGSCASGYCAADGLCHTPRRQGKSCNRDAQCRTGFCSSAGKCIKSTSAHPAPSATSKQASAALASATPVSNSEQYNNAKLLPGSGQVRTTGSVNIVNTARGQAIEVFADGTHPAVVEKVLQNKLTRRQASEAKTFSFNYNVASFTSSDPTNGQCSIVPSINGNNLSPATIVKTGSTSGTVTYQYTGSVSSYALALVCDSTSSAKVDYDSVTVTSASTPTSTTPTASSTSSTTTTTTTTSSSVPTSTVIASRCSGLSNCGFEDGNTNGFTVGATGDGTKSVTNDAATAHMGTYSLLFTVPGTSRFNGGYIQGGDGHTYVSGNDYTWLFWIKPSNGGSIEGTRCFVEANNGQSRVYGGNCAVTTATAQNGYQQVAIPFNATATSMQFTLSVQGVPGNYLVDDISMLDGSPTLSYVSPPVNTPVAVASF